MTTKRDTQPTGLYAWLLAQQARLNEEIAYRRAELEEVEIAMAALAPRQAPAMRPDAERGSCRNCGGPIERGEASRVWTHDRDGQQACKPGHSGPVAEPLDQTTAFPAVSPQDATQVIPAVLPWSHVHAGQHVNVYWADGGYLSGTVLGANHESLSVDTGERVYGITPAEIKSVELAEPDRIECVHCGKALARLPHADWHHAASGLIACHPDGVVSTEATPPADLDQVTATPAERPDGEADHG